MKQQPMIRMRRRLVGATVRAASPIMRGDLKGHDSGSSWHAVPVLRYAVTLALGGIAAVALSACSDADSAGELASPSVPVVVSAAPSVTPSPSVTPEENLLARIPEEARYESFPSSVEFARFFLELYMPMFAPPYDTELFEFLCTDESIYCSSALQDAKDTEDARAYSEGGEFTWSDDIRGGLQPDGRWNVSQSFVRNDITTYLEDGSVYRVSKGGAGDVGVELVFDDGTWRVTAVAFAYTSD